MTLVRRPFGWELQLTHGWLAVLHVRGCLMWDTCYSVSHKEQTQSLLCLSHLACGAIREADVLCDL